MNRRVVISGVGTVNGIGQDALATWAAVAAGHHGIGPITHYATEGRRVTLAAEVKGYCPEDYFAAKEARHLDPYIQFALIAAREALADAGDLQVDPYRLGTVVASGIGGLSTIEGEDRRVSADNKFDRVTPYFIPMVISNMGAAQVAMTAKAKGPSMSVASACASSTTAVGQAFRMIRDGYQDAMLAGGCEASITPLAIGGFTAMRALHMGKDPDRASIPFDRDRSGFVMGEGAAILVLEEADRAVARGGHIYAEIIGYGETCDAHHITAPAEDGQAAGAAIRQALAEGGLAPGDLDYINAHGTSTPLNDKIESQVFRNVFGQDLPRVSSTKALTGHLLGAVGALEALICAQALAHNAMPGQFGTLHQDPACALPLAKGGEAVATALTNTLGFGGHNACLLLKRWEGPHA